MWRSSNFRPTSVRPSGCSSRKVLNRLARAGSRCPPSSWRPIAPSSPCENCYDSRATRRDADPRSHQSLGGVRDAGAPAAPAAGARWSVARLRGTHPRIARDRAWRAGGSAERLHQPVFAVSIAGGARHRNLSGGRGVHDQPSRPLAMVAAAARAGFGSVGRHHRLWLPDRLGQRPTAFTWARRCGASRPSCSPACRWRSRSR